MTETIDTAWKALLYLAGGISAIFVAGSQIFKLFNPYKQIVKRLDGHDDKLAKDLERFEAHEKQHDEDRHLREADRADIAVLMKGQLALLEHEKTGNATGTMDAACRELQAHLISRK